MSSRSHLGKVARQRFRRPPGNRGSFAAVQSAFAPVRATGSSNVESFAWQPTGEQESADFHAVVDTYGSLEYGAMRYAADGDPSGILTVAFLSGATYQYDAPLSVFLAMLGASSRGQFVYYQLNQYPYIGPM